MNEKKLFAAVAILAAAFVVLAGFVADTRRQVAKQPVAAMPDVEPLIVSSALLTPAAHQPAACQCQRGEACNCPCRHEAGAAYESRLASYESQVEYLKDDLAAARQTHRAEIREWENWYDGLNRWLASKGLRAVKRKQREPIVGDAMNDGLHGEGRPRVGEYGETWVRGGNVRVDCPQCEHR